ncbi:MAG: DUF5606 domain-containing protein [Muribaculaceae bacterium]|nr:DUF5606 domain-containing protein [Muribaculaceae bacterium]
MLKKILCISGRSGLYELKSYGKNMVIVESLKDHKRSPAYSRDKIISLGDIAIYTTNEEVPLGKVFDIIFVQQEGKTLVADDYKTNEQIDAFFAKVLPDYDVDRVYRADIKKVINWYNILVEAGFTKFFEEEKAEEESVEEK